MVLQIQRAWGGGGICGSPNICFPGHRRQSLLGTAGESSAEDMILAMRSTPQRNRCLFSTNHVEPTGWPPALRLCATTDVNRPSFLAQHAGPCFTKSRAKFVQIRLARANVGRCKPKSAKFGSNLYYRGNFCSIPRLRGGRQTNPTRRCAAARRTARPRHLGSPLYDGPSSEDAPVRVV